MKNPALKKKKVKISRTIIYALLILISIINLFPFY